MIRVTRRYAFSASHRLDVAGLTEDQNRSLYGKCNNPYGHGHNYILDVSVRGPVDARSGRAVDPAALDRLVQDRILSLLHLKNLNQEIETFRTVVPTTENIGLLIHQRLKQNWPAAFPGAWPQLEKVRIAETERNIFEVSESH
jgi:6-pyruvoyltetrahydropterin/6-carboxytetrahydropterin synthase